MASHATVPAATAAVLLCTAPKHGFVVIQNEDAAIKVFVGGATVSNAGATAGLSLAAGKSIQLAVACGEQIYVSAASGTPSVSFIFTS